MDIYEEVVLEECPNCRGVGLLEEEGDYCWYVMCMDCGAQTAPIEYKSAAERREAALKAANLWNRGKVIRSENGE